MEKKRKEMQISLGQNENAKLALSVRAIVSDTIRTRFPYCAIRFFAQLK